MPFSVTILGSSSAIPTSNRFLTAHLVNHDERFFLIDCGEGTQIQLRRLKTKFSRINHIFISHLHGDHVFGLFGLISSMSMLGRKIPLHIYSNSKLEEILKSHFSFFNDDIKFPIVYHPIGSKNSELIYDDNKIEIITIPLKHRIPCVGFLFREKKKLRNIKKIAIEEYNLGIKDIIAIKKGEDFISDNGKIIPNNLITTSPPLSKSYAFCTDTKYNENIIPLISGVDILYHESTFLSSDIKLAKSTYHSTAAQAATIALKANVKQLVIGHFSSRYKHDKEYLTEAKSIFENTIMAKEGLILNI